jgi:hypothetical protein
MPEKETKPWYASKTIWGAIVTIISLLLSLKGIQIDEQTKQVLIDQGTAAITAVGTFIGSIVAVYGRIKAEKKIG